MKPETIEKLLDVNNQFYQKNAQSFHRTRQLPRSGWDRVIQQLETKRDLTALDVGCGNGLFGEYLDRKGFTGTYIGIDNADGLLKEAKGKVPIRLKPRFIKGDIAAPKVFQGLEKMAFDLVVCFAVLHHIPSFRLRRKIVEQLLALTGPEGLAAFSFWNFYEHQRFEAKLINPEEFKGLPTIRNIEPKDLEKGDFMMKWQDSPLPRYVHWIDELEVKMLFEGLPVKVDQFLAEGTNNTLNRYVLVRKSLGMV